MHAGNPEPGCCVNCGAQRDGGQLEVINPLGNRACANTVACELRGLGIDPAEHLIVVARAVGKDLAGLSEHDLAALITVLKPVIVAVEIELGNNRPRDRGDAALAQAQQDYAPRPPVTPGGPRYIARFTPEAWQRNDAVEIDPLGDQEWDATAFAAEATYDREDVRGQHRLDYLDWLHRTAIANEGPGLDSPDGVLDTDDVFFADPAAPPWVTRHQGPYTIRVRRETPDHIKEEDR
jgi:hypothetical protein